MLWILCCSMMISWSVPPPSLSIPPPCPQITQIVLLFQQNHILLPHSREDQGTRVHLSEPHASHAIYWARHGTSGRIPDATRPFCISACRRKYPRTAITHTSPQIQIHRQTETHSHICIQIQDPIQSCCFTKKSPVLWCFSRFLSGTLSVLHICTCAQKGHLRCLKKKILIHLFWCYFFEPKRCFFLFWLLSPCLLFIPNICELFTQGNVHTTCCFLLVPP